MIGRSTVLAQAGKMPGGESRRRKRARLLGSKIENLGRVADRGLGLIKPLGLQNWSFERKGKLGLAKSFGQNQQSNRRRSQRGYSFPR